MQTLSKIFIILMLVFLSGCSKFLAPDESAPQINNQLPTAISFAVLDYRSYVIDGDKAPSFEGLYRSNFGIPYSQYTYTREDMAVYLASRIKIGIEKKGIEVTQVVTTHKDPFDKITSNLLSKGQPSLLIVLYEWKYDYHPFTDNSYYKILVQLRESNGGLVYDEMHKGENDIPSGGIINEMQLIYKQRFEQIFNSDKFKTATLELMPNA